MIAGAVVAVVVAVAVAPVTVVGINDLRAVTAPTVMPQATTISPVRVGRVHLVCWQTALWRAWWEID